MVSSNGILMNNDWMSDDAIHIKIIILFTDVFAKPEQDFDSVVVNCIFFEKKYKKT